ncbi:hypothetical protein P3X46_001350 [Hevea brasiliensis]|uniref:Malectin-like domain-containing protein n=1 Tax=Hevea brasiliensis TaxID=3981 RepID=A0ABQ9NGB6_HEVBR|nr:hypothetical protein P3X46_001350 [Hevea brasiliensis]
MDGGATPDIAPPTVYGTATIMNSSARDVNVTWEFSIDPGFQYLLRFHFCDIMSNEISQLYCNVYVDSWLLVKDLNPNYFSYTLLANAIYMDFVSALNVSNKLRVNIGPSSIPNVLPNAILNGLDIMKMNNSLGSLSGSATLLSDSTSYKTNEGMLVGFITGAVIAVLFAAIICML